MSPNTTILKSALGKHMSFVDGTLDASEREVLVSRPSSPLSCFQPVNVEQTRQLVSQSKSTTAKIDPVPTKFLLDFIGIFFCPWFRRSLTSISSLASYQKH